MLNELEQKLYDISVHEIENREWGVTQQYLDVMKVAQENGKPKLARIEYSNEFPTKLYFEIEDENIFFTTFFDENNKLIGIDITPGSYVYLRVFSEDLDLQEILLKTSLIPNESHHKSQISKYTKRKYDSSGFNFWIDKQTAGDFENKILTLLKALEPHKSELLELQKDCWMLIQSYWCGYVGNLGGFSMDKETIRLLYELNLEIDFDMYAGGEPFKSGDE